MRRREFVSGNLHRIRDRIADSTSDIKREPFEENKENLSSSEKKVDVDKTSRPPKDKNFKKALEKRREEFLKVRRDVMGRLAHELVCVPHEIEKSLTHLKEAEEAEKKFKKLFSEVEKLSDSGWNEDNYSAELGDAMKKIENIRLEVIKSSTRLDKIKNNMPVKNAGGEPQFGIHEIASLSFRQTLKLGMNFFLPVIIALIVCSFILSCAIIISMAGF